MKKKVSRQYKAQLKNHANGMCGSHKSRPIFASGFCEECWHKSRERARPGIKHRTQQEIREMRDSIDWTLPNSSIAAKTGMGLSNVSRCRKREAPPHLRNACEVKRQWIANHP